MLRTNISTLLLAVALFLCGCGEILGPSFPLIPSPRVTVATPAGPASGNITISFQLIDRELESADILVQYSTDGGQTFATATLTNPADAANLGSGWYPGATHTLQWDSVTDMIGRSGEVTVCVKITPSDASNPSGTADITGTFTVNNIAYNEAPSATVSTPAGVQSSNIQINYFLADVESDTCSIAVDFSTNGGSTWQSATMGPAGDGLTGLSSSPSGAAHTFLWDSRTDNVGLASQQDNVKIRITPTDFNEGTVDETNAFSVDNTTPNIPPTVNITSGPSQGSTVYTSQVTFGWNGSDTDGTITGYYYSFDQDPPDAWTTNTSVTSGVLSEASHTFRVAAMDDEGALSTVASRTFTVSAGIIQANFTASPVSGSAPLAVSFTDTSTSTSGITSWSWSFGDGGTSSAQNPSHTYNSAGTYTVTLTVSGPDGSDTQTRTSYISVTLPGSISANFTADTTVDEAPLTVQFTDLSTSTSGITSWSWSFGDGGTSSAQNPSHTYSSIGSFTVTLTVTGPDGSDTETKTNYITATSPGGNTIYVDGASGNDLSNGLSWATAVRTIQTGLNKAGASGWTVFVANGTYTGSGNRNLGFVGRAIHLKSAGGAANCIIDCQNSDRGFYFASSETNDSIVDGFTIRNGSDPYGGAIRCDESSPTITNCIIRDNSSGFAAGGIFGSPNCNPKITNCLITNNTALHGAAMYFGDASSPSVTNCLIVNNSADMNGGGIWCGRDCDLTITNCTIAGNSSDLGGGIRCFNNSSPVLNNSLLWGNSAVTSGNQIYADSASSDVALNYCDYANGLGDVESSGTVTPSNCINLNPLFVNAAAQDYHLQDGSPCIDVGNNSYVSGVTTDFDGNARIQNSTVDIGAYEYQSPSSEPVYCWTKAIGSGAEDGGCAIATDVSGNVYVTGFFTGTVDFGADFGTSDSKASQGFSDIYVTKINSDGSYAWTKVMGGASYDHGDGIAVDSSGNVYVTGFFEGTVDFGADFGTSDSKTSQGDRDIFVTRINSNGSYGWTRAMGSAPDDYGNSIAVDGSGNVYVTGYFQGTVDFGADFGTSDSKTLQGDVDIFVIKVNSDGSYGWTRAMGGALADVGRAVATDPSGNVYVTGYFESMVNFGADFGASDIKTSQGTKDIFVTKINSNGTYGWTKAMGGGAWDDGLGIATDGSGNVYVTGCFRETVDFGTDFGTSESKTSQGIYDIFVTRINSNGTYGWTKAMGGGGIDNGKRIATDGSGNVYVAGYFNGTVDFGADFGTTDSKTSQGDADIFVTKVDSNGSYGWTRAMGGALYDYGRGIATDGSGNVYVISSFYDAVDFGADFGTSDSKTSQGDWDISVTKIKP